MNEAETRAEHIDLALRAAGWSVVEGSRVRREYLIAPGRIEPHGRRAKATKADYVLEYRNHKLGIIEAKAWDSAATEGLGQAKRYADKLGIRFAYSTNGQAVYGADLKTGKEGDLAAYPTPAELWNLTFAEANEWRERFAAVPFEDRSGTLGDRYFRDIAIERVLEAIADGRERILLTLATGTGKTMIVFQIAWKLFHSRWNISRQPMRRPRILFLADRNILADQAFNAFSPFDDQSPGSLVRIAPDEIRKKGKVPKNGSIFFTIFQTFMASAGSATEEAVTIRGISEHEISNAFAYAYILRCADGSFYTGSITNLRLRLQQHRAGEGAKHTGARLPLELVYYETFDRIDEAFDREKQIQGWSRAKKLALINRDALQLQRLARNPSAPDSPVPEPVEGPVPEPVEGPVPEPVEGYFGEYPRDFFDFIIIDECHRGGAQDESNWRGIMDYFAPAVQLGLTATPKRKDNVDTYRYFGEPVYVYSLKDGINDGFLTPFKVKQFATTIDDYIYTPDDRVMEGEIEPGKRYGEKDFNRSIVIDERERKRVDLFMREINQSEKTLVFCATQDHALAVRDYINQIKKSKEPNYCARVTANDGELGNQHLRDFQDNEKTIPTILTTSQKLSTGVDARNVRNIVLMRPVNSMIEFKQIIGRGTRLFEGKDYFTIYDFVKAYEHFNDPEWDGPPVEEEPCKKCGQRPCICEKPQPPGVCAICGKEPCECPKEACPVCGETPCICRRKKTKVKVKLADGKERTIQHMMMTSFWHPDGTPMSSQQFMEALFGKLPEFFKNEDELRALWSDPTTRTKLLEGLAEKGFGREQLAEMQKSIDAEKSDLFDVLAYVAYLLPTISREERATRAKLAISTEFSSKQQIFLDFVLKQYVQVGVEELLPEKLGALLRLKYNNAIADAVAELGAPDEINRLFSGFQKHLYERAA